MTAKVIHAAGRRFVPVWHFGKARAEFVAGLDQVEEGILQALKAMEGASIRLSS